MLIAEVTTSKLLTPDQQRLAALKRNAEQARKSLQAEKERQKISKAQQQLRAASQAVLLKKT